MKINETLSAFKLFFVPRLTHFLLWQGKINNGVGGKIWRKRKVFWVKKTRLAFLAAPRSIIILYCRICYKSFRVYIVRNNWGMQVCMKLKITQGGYFFLVSDYVFIIAGVHLPQKTCLAAPLANGKIEQKNNNIKLLICCSPFVL